MQKINEFLEKKTVLILVIAIILYVMLFSLICLWKYTNYSYDLLDLSIINQVFFNSASGDFFASSIHPPSYLGDHFTPILILLLPFYFLFKSPLTLLFLQTIILALCAWPIYLIANKILNRRWGLFFALMFLVNPLIANVNLFEFHFIPFAIFTLLWAIYFYLKEDFWKFLLFIFLSLLIREDVSLVIFMFGILALFDRKKNKWVLTPIFLSILYFIISVKITSIFWPGGNYKFMIYYSWLGENWPELIKNSILKIDKVFLHFFKLGNIEMILGLLLPFALLPLLAPKFLILTLLIFVQFVLGEAGGSALIVKTHYSSLFIPALFTATIIALKKFQNKKIQFIFFKFLQKEKTLAILIFVVAIIYTSIALGPSIGIIKTIKNTKTIKNNTDIKNKMIEQIDPNDSVVSSYGALTPLSSRKNVYSLHYIYMGYQQFSRNKYVLIDPVDAMLIDYQDLFTYYLQYYDKLEEDEELNPNNLNELIKNNNLGLVEITNGIALYKKNVATDYALYQIHNQIPSIDFQQSLNLDDQMMFLGYSLLPNNGVATYWQKIGDSDNYFIRTNSDDIFLLAYGLYPLKNWGVNEIVQMNFWFDHTKNNSQVSLEVIEVEGGVILSGIRSTQNAIKTKTIGESIQIQLPTN
ncbi:DUF2079 domain-containing protein [Patescibacteria group bacterium]|nr:DUF2079 domain-containing protein [Patescibacteria group bacterium]